MNKLPTQSTVVGDILLAIFFICCVAGFPFPILLVAFSSAHFDPTGIPVPLLFISFLAYAGTCLGSALLIQKSPLRARRGLIVLGIAWMVPWMLDALGAVF